MHLPPEASLGDWLAYLEQLHTQAIDLGLERVAVVAERLNLPLGKGGRSRPVVYTVAGTNGKGSTCDALRQLSLAAGCRVGFYSSPHLIRFNERVVIDQSEVNDETLIRAFERVEAVRGDTSLTYFEFTTLAAFVIFNDADLDVWVLEVGLGGRLDAVNLVDADVTVVTTVDRDHEAFLGSDLEIIGREKAGIFRAGSPAVLGSEPLPASVYATADRLQAPLWPYGRQHGADAQTLWWQSGRISRSEITATVPAANLATAVQAFMLGGFELEAETVKAALNQVRLPGRMQWVTRNGRRYVLDVGHNPHAARYLAEQLASESWSVVLGMLADKDVENVVQALSPLAGDWYLASLDVPRGLTARQLRHRTTLANAQCYDSVTAAIDAAGQEERPVLICGSFYTVSEALAALVT